MFYVIRLKDNAVLEIVKERAVPQNRNILHGQIIRLSGPGAQNECQHLLRHVVVWYSEHEREIVPVTNHKDFGATTVIDAHRQRWQIEVFLTLKQNLKVKSFVSVSENTLLLPRCLHHSSKTRWSLSNLAALLPLKVFTYSDLERWIDDR